MAGTTVPSLLRELANEIPSRNVRRTLIWPAEQRSAERGIHGYFFSYQSWPILVNYCGQDKEKKYWALSVNGQ